MNIARANVYVWPKARTAPDAQLVTRRRPYDDIAGIHVIGLVDGMRNGGGDRFGLEGNLAEKVDCLCGFRVGDGIGQL